MTAIAPADKRPAKRARDGIAEKDDLFAVSRLAAEPACQQIGSTLLGLSVDEAARRLAVDGANLVTRERKLTMPEEIWNRAKNPLNALLLTLATTSYFLGDIRAAVVIVIMVVLSIITAFIQEHRSNQAAARLRAMVKTTASVRRGAADGQAEFAELPMEMLVPGDVVRLSAGDICDLLAAQVESSITPFRCTVPSLKPNDAPTNNRMADDKTSFFIVLVLDFLIGNQI